LRFFLLLLFVLTTVLTAQTADMAEGVTQTEQNRSIEGEPEEEFGTDEGFDEFEDEFDESQKEDIFDPLSGYNRFMTGFNDGLFNYVLDPFLLKGYNFILPEPARDSVYRFFENIYFPVSLANNLLQLKFKNSATETLRFVINSTIGILGLFDPAKNWFDLEIHKEDFGQTLGHYGVGGGFHIVMPFFGPKNLRDFGGDLIDFYAYPLYYVEVRKLNIVQNKYQGWAAITYKEFNEISLHAEEYKNIRKDALDLYPFLRDLYEKNRENEIKE